MRKGGMRIDNDMRTRSRLPLWTLPLALLTPPIVALAVGVLLGEGYSVLVTLRDVPVVGPALVAPIHAVIWLYTLDLQVGSMDPAYVLLGLYLVFAAVYAVRRQWVAASVVLLLPLLSSWWFAASMLQD